MPIDSYGMRGGYCSMIGNSRFRICGSHHLHFSIERGREPLPHVRRWRRNSADNPRHVRPAVLRRRSSFARARFGASAVPSRARCSTGGRPLPDGGQRVDLAGAVEVVVQPAPCRSRAGRSARIVGARRAGQRRRARGSASRAARRACILPKRLMSSAATPVTCGADSRSPAGTRRWRRFPSEQSCTSRPVGRALIERLAGGTPTGPGRTRWCR